MKLFTPTPEMSRRMGNSWGFLLVHGAETLTSNLSPRSLAAHSLASESQWNKMYQKIVMMWV